MTLQGGKALSRAKHKAQQMKTKCLSNAALMQQNVKTVFTRSAKQTSVDKQLPLTARR